MALAAGEAISDLLVEMKEKALSASDATLSASQRSAYSEDFEALRDQIAQITTNADFNGVNLIDGSTAEIAAIANADGSNSLTVAAEDLSLSGSIVTITSAQDISTVTEAAAALTSVSASLENLNEALARLGTASKRVEVHNTFVTAMRDSIENGVGNLVDADMARESARLQALQTKQQLGVQALSIANQAPTIINSLFQ